MKLPVSSGSWMSASKLLKSTFVILYLTLISVNNPTHSGAVELTSSNFDSLLASTELVFVNFYADWCRFSNLLAPIFDEAADKISKEVGDPNKVVLGRVDCDKQSSVASRYKVSKYPTLKLIRNGIPLKKEYRGQRSPEAFLEFIKKQLESPVVEFKELKEVMEIDEKKRVFLAYMETNTSKAYENYRRVASNLKEECLFYAGFGDASRQMHPPGHDIVAFRPDRSRSMDQDETFTGNVESFDELLAWIQAKCVALVREITFENAEELTEEGLPFLILFHHPDDAESVKKFNNLVQQELLEERQSITFLTADGKKFAHPLHHLGKAEKDLPLIAIDSFRHMYLFPDAKQMEIPGKVKQFIQNLHSGKLHREYHYGPDPSEPQNQEVVAGGDQQLPTNPPESTFKKLAPSENRYSFAQRDEL